MQSLFCFDTIQRLSLAGRCIFLKYKGREDTKPKFTLSYPNSNLLGCCSINCIIWGILFHSLNIKWLQLEWGLRTVTEVIFLALTCCVATSLATENQKVICISAVLHDLVLVYEKVSQCGKLGRCMGSIFVSIHQAWQAQPIHKCCFMLSRSSLFKVGS